MISMSRTEYPGWMYIVISHSSIMKGYDEYTKKLGKNKVEVGIITRENNIEFGFDVDTKKYDIDKAEYIHKGKQGKIEIKIPLRKK